MPRNGGSPSEADADGEELARRQRAEHFRQLVPSPRLVEREIHGQRVVVKVYPPTADPRWAEWIQHTLRAPLEPPARPE
jgi:hypothetical protein